MHYDEDYHAGLINAGSSDPGSRWSQPRDMVLKYKRSGSILDIGCSSGGFLSTFDKKNWKLYGIELSSDTAQLAREVLGERYLQETLRTHYLRPTRSMLLRLWTFWSTFTTPRCCCPIF